MRQCYNTGISELFMLGPKFKDRFILLIIGDGQFYRMFDYLCRWHLLNLIYHSFKLLPHDVCLDGLLSKIVEGCLHWHHVVDIAEST